MKLLIHSYHSKVQRISNLIPNIAGHVIAIHAGTKLTHVGERGLR